MLAADTSRIAVTDANLRVPNKKVLHQALMRNGFIPPRAGESICTVKFMKNVRTKKYWCPSSVEGAHVKPCADPPSKKELAAILYRVMTTYRPLGEPHDSGLRRTAKWVRKRPPNADWSLMVLATIDGDNEIFGRGYVHKRQKNADVEHAQAVDNADNFFDSLPVVPGASGRRGLNFLCKRQLKDARLKQLRFRMYKLQDRMRVMGERGLNDDELGSDAGDSDSEDGESSDDSGLEQSDAVNPLVSASQPVDRSRQSQSMHSSRHPSGSQRDDQQAMQPPVNILVNDDNASAASSRHNANVIGNEEEMDVQLNDARSATNRQAFGDMTLATANRVNTPPQRSLKFGAHQQRQRNSRAAAFTGADNS